MKTPYDPVIASDDPFEASVASAWPADRWRGVHVVVAVSGGPDSVALLRAADAIRRRVDGPGDLIVAHFDHRVRADESERDAAWVRELAARLGRDYRVGVSSHRGERSEGALRDERREFLRRVVHAAGARYLATGHTADDQVETVLFRILRGSGVAGLSGIAASRPLDGVATLVRPLLAIGRDEVLAYLRRLDQPFRTDPTNASAEATRNWIRHELLPCVERRFGGARQAVLRLAEQAAESQSLLGSLAEATLAEAGFGESSSGDSVALSATVLATTEPLLAVEAIRLAWRRAGWPEQAVTASHWRSVLAVACGGAAAVALPGEIDARLVGDRLVITRR